VELALAEVAQMAVARAAMALEAMGAVDPVIAWANSGRVASGVAVVRAGVKVVVADACSTRVDKPPNREQPSLEGLRFGTCSPLVTQGH
jgi:hypothetical protein